MTLKLSICEATDKGPRAQNQDAVRVVTPAPLLAASKGHLLAVADGVSHCQDGGLAANATLQALALDYYSTPETWTIPHALDKLLTAHNRWLRVNGGGQPLLTTLTALVLRGERYTLAHIGDCRAYLLRDGKLRNLTSEHVWEQPGMEHVLKRALGLDEHLLMDYIEGELRAHDQLLIVSDGVWASLKDSEIHGILHEQPFEQACPVLLERTYRAGSQDNASALLVRVDALPESSLSDALAPLDERALPPQLKTGQPFEGWEVVNVRAESRQSLLYRVRDPLQQTWLLKTLPASLQDDQQARQALVLEEWFMRRVAGAFTPELHPLPQRRHLYYVMREYAGVTLEEQRRQLGLLSIPAWRALAAQMVKAVGKLHQRNLIHRDIKPENLHQGEDGQLRVLDFGLTFCPGLTQQETGRAPGTPSYRAPEALRGAEPHPQQDIYSTGVTLYFLLTGHYPYGEVEAFQRPRFGKPIPASRYRPDVPPWIDTMLLRAVAAEPKERFETAEEWLLELAKGENQPLHSCHEPLLKRDPLRFWRYVALTSLALNLLLVVQLLTH
ncbi:protein kinase domain-containing protein [Pseudomonas neustonica]|uniref:Bifunctional protein-serine/threonine kinase/phosphatase n=1 Tax=Pseudomonas neustonica TaxID=2487346 RepID=A0ABX9XE73_9PSED|nr:MULTISPECIES: bifunctional protein-serine/threonine kinase/phosphatase [Pseudomonas]MAB25134.1 protein kinase [Pseudomonadales bacterium]ROZ80557.1 bifunctional protein-serine/threonine kinase/phosphatase [Pseudomonas sp. SSM44]ROZ81758.1 bifunctional protein-serine/threonine kinase/phosphatase [Pseudomonas neustonica]|tara:strand:- start:6848 stop:8515 length:1668 start_codon:yes stop_codon:yes gene_type:complete